MKQVYMLHGMHVDHEALDQDWCLWLQANLQARLNALGAAQQVQANCIGLPHPEQPNFQSWQQILSRELVSINAQSVIIADDAACLALLHYLTQSRQQVYAILLIAPFTQPLPNRPALTDFIAAARLNMEQLRLQADKRVLFFSSNDPLVPPPFSLKLAPLLNMQLVEVKNAGHFAHLQDPAAYAPLLQAVSKLLQLA